MRRCALIVIAWFSKLLQKNRQIFTLNEQLQEAQKQPLLFAKPEIAEPEVQQPETEVKTPEIEVASGKVEVASSNLLGVSEPVEKGLSASSYFDTIGAKGDTSATGTVTQI